MNRLPDWSRQYVRDSLAPPELVWAEWADVATWPAWNAGVVAIELEGPFRTGTWFTMRLPDGTVLRSQLLEVEAPRRFVDETACGDTRIRVDHRVAPLPQGGCRITLEVAADGPEAAAIGEGASADFPEVLAALAQRAERAHRSGAR